MASKVLDLVKFRATRIFMKNWRENGEGTLRREFAEECIGTIADALRDLAVNPDGGNALTPLLRKTLLG